MDCTNTSDGLTQGALTRKRSQHLLQGLLNRVVSIDAQCTHNHFPLYSTNTDNNWILSKGGSWTGGFWAGCWWLRSLITGATDDEKKALTICQHLNGKLTADTINRSMIFWYATALGAQLAYSPYAKQLATQAASYLVLSYNAKLGFVPAGTAMGGGRNGHSSLVIDCLSPLIQLCMYSNNHRAESIAHNHLTSAINLNLSADGAWSSHRYYDGQQFVSASPYGHWARGQAWGLLGLARAAFYWGDPYTGYALKALDYWSVFMQGELAVDKLSAWNNQPYDPSAMLIVALSCAILATVSANPRFTRCFKQYLSAVVNSEYFVERPQGDSIFYGSNANIAKDKKAMLETSWGLYLLMLCLAIELNCISPVYS
ncbi:MAG: hypothetical protein AAFZ92_04340 [Pseudomonadota bacterium]